jgi:hypothetical protein
MWDRLWLSEMREMHRKRRVVKETVKLYNWAFATGLGGPNMWLVRNPFGRAGMLGVVVFGDNENIKDGEVSK